MSDYCPRCYRAMTTTTTTTTTLRRIDMIRTELRTWRIFRAILVTLIALGVILPCFFSLDFFWPAGAAVISALGATVGLIWMTFDRYQETSIGRKPPIPALRYQLDELRDQLAQQQAAS